MSDSKSRPSSNYVDRLLSPASSSEFNPTLLKIVKANKYDKESKRMVATYGNKFMLALDSLNGRSGLQVEYEYLTRLKPANDFHRSDFYPATTQ